MQITKCPPRLVRGLRAKQTVQTVTRRNTKPINSAALAAWLAASAKGKRNAGN